MGAISRSREGKQKKATIPNENGREHQVAEFQERGRGIEILASGRILIERFEVGRARKEEEDEEEDDDEEGKVGMILSVGIQMGQGVFSSAWPMGLMRRRWGGAASDSRLL